MSHDGFTEQNIALDSDLMICDVAFTDLAINTS